MGTLALLHGPSATWQPFSDVWNSGSNTSVTLEIFDLQTDNSVPGNDFALDDISLTVPEPSALLLLGLGSAALALVRRKVRKL